ncbi:hypothetical protein NGRA_3469, partial [Nosema granulosis]
ALEKRFSENIKYVEDQAKQALQALEKFAENYILPVNTNKTKAMIVHNVVASIEPELKYKNVSIEYVTSYKCLGVEICSKLGWSKHIDYRLKLVRKSYCGLRKIFKSIPRNEIKLRRKLFLAFSLPHFIWLFFTWFFYTEKQCAQIEHIYNTGVRLVYSMWGFEDLTTLAVCRELSLRDYLYRYWIKLYKHLEVSSEAVSYRQTWTSFVISTDTRKSYYKSMGFRKNSKFPNRLAERAHHSKLDILTFINMHRTQFRVFQISSAILETFILKYFPVFHDEKEDNT